MLSKLIHLRTALAPAIWGTTHLITSTLLPPDVPLLAGVLRALPAGLMLLLVTRQLPHGSWWWKSLILGALTIGIFFPLLFLAAYRLPGGVAATIGAVQPLIVQAIAVRLVGEQLRTRAILAGLAGLEQISARSLLGFGYLSTVGVRWPT